MTFPAAGAAFLLERLPNNARISVLMLGEDRADFTDHFAGIPAQIRWLELEQWPFEVKKKGPNKFLAESAIYSFLLQMAQSVA